MTHRLHRLLRPRSIAVVGGGFWCTNVIQQCRKFGFSGTVTPVHPTRAELGGLPAVASLRDLPDAPDATFIGVNRQTTIDVVRDLAEMGAGGAVCFASGFREAEAEIADGANLQEQLIAVAGDMPILGPNCYGFINALDTAALWPDQHGATPVDSGVALITQSSNIAINLTMQRRGLPIAYAVTAGNQAAVSLPEIGLALLDDPRVTALGLHIEGISDLRGMEKLARHANALGKPIVALKVGTSDQAQIATISHTASLAGSAAGGRALLKRLNIAQVDSLPQLLETLRLAHAIGPLANTQIATASCSGGEASLAADSALRHGLNFPPLTATQRGDLSAALGPQVALANPLDYHTYIWGDVPAMTATFAALAQGAQALTCIIVDFPRTDVCDPSAWTCVIDAAKAARLKTGKRIALLSTLPETQDAGISQQITDSGLIPLGNIDDAFAAIAALCQSDECPQGLEEDLLLPIPADAPKTMSEAESKALLANHGLAIPRSQRATNVDELTLAAADIGAPLVIKAEGLAHKSDQGGVVFARETTQNAVLTARKMPTQSWLVEQMIPDAVVELLIGVTCDPAHGYVLTVGSGGVLTEVHADTASVLIPASRGAIDKALDTLRLAPLLNGYRNLPATNRPAIIDAVIAVQDFVIAHHGRVAEVEVNPLICTQHDAIAVDALITLGESP